MSFMAKPLILLVTGNKDLLIISKIRLISGDVWTQDFLRCTQNLRLVSSIILNIRLE